MDNLLEIRATETLDNVEVQRDLQRFPQRGEYERDP